MHRDRHGDQRRERRATAERDAHRHAFGKTVQRHHRQDQEDPLGPGAAQFAEAQILVVEETIAGEDEQQAYRTADNALREAAFSLYAAYRTASDPDTAAQALDAFRLG